MGIGATRSGGRPELPEHWRWDPLALDLHRTWTLPATVVPELAGLTHSMAQIERYQAVRDRLDVPGVSCATEAEWRQWDSFTTPGGQEVLIGDADRTCFLMRAGDLERRDFDAAWAVWVG